MRKRANSKRSSASSKSSRSWKPFQVARKTAAYPSCSTLAALRSLFRVTDPVNYPALSRTPRKPKSRLSSTCKLRNLTYQKESPSRVGTTLTVRRSLAGTTKSIIALKYQKSTKATRNQKTTRITRSLGSTGTARNTETARTAKTTRKTGIRARIIAAGGVEVATTAPTTSAVDTAGRKSERRSTASRRSGGTMTRLPRRALPPFRPSLTPTTGYTI